MSLVWEKAEELVKEGIEKHKEKGRGDLIARAIRDDISNFVVGQGDLVVPIIDVSSDPLGLESVLYRLDKKATSKDMGKVVSLLSELGYELDRPVEHASPIEYTINFVKSGKENSSIKVRFCYHPDYLFFRAYDMSAAKTVEKIAKVIGEKTEPFKYNPSRLGIR